VVLAGPLALVATVLVVSGVQKVRLPAATVPALAAAGLPPRRWAAWAVGAGEVAVGTTALVVSARGAATALAAAYLLLTTVSRRLLRSEGLQNCGCFGRAGAPPHPAQVAANAACAVVAGVAAVAGTEALVPVVADSPAAGALLTALVLVGTFGLVAVHRELPAALTVQPSPSSFRLRSTR